MAQAAFPKKGAQARRKSDGMHAEVYASDSRKQLLTLRWAKAPSVFETLVCSGEQFARDWELTGAMVPRPKGCAVAMALTLVGAFLFCVFLVTRGCGSSSTVPVAPEAAAPDTAVDLSDAKALNEKYESSAGASCEVGADDYLRSAAKYDFKWDEMGMLDSKFDKFLTHVTAPGVLTIISDKVKLSNGFGAFQHIKLFCNYDTQQDKVISYSVETRDE